MKMIKWIMLLLGPVILSIALFPLYKDDTAKPGDATAIDISGEPSSVKDDLPNSALISRAETEKSPVLSDHISTDETNVIYPTKRGQQRTEKGSGKRRKTGWFILTSFLFSFFLHFFVFLNHIIEMDNLSIAVVPVPPALYLLTSGLLGLFMMRLKLAKG